MAVCFSEAGYRPRRRGSTIVVGSMNQNLERPIATEREDRLGHREFAARLLSAALEPDGRATGGGLGLTGPAGSGKSSILNLLAELVEEHHPATAVVMFNPWLANSRNGL